MCSPTAPPAQARAYYANPPACQSPITGVIRSPHHNTLTFRSPLVIKPRMESCAYTKPESLDSRGRQSYRALTAQCGFAVALLPLAIRAQARPSAVGNTGSARPIGLRRYGLVRGYVLTSLRAYTAFFSTVWLALSSRKRLGHYAKSCIEYGYPTSSSSHLSSIDCLRLCIELHRRRHKRHGRRRRSHRPKTSNMD